VIVFDYLNIVDMKGMDRSIHFGNMTARISKEPTYILYSKDKPIKESLDTNYIFQNNFLNMSFTVPRSIRTKVDRISQKVEIVLTVGSDVLSYNYTRNMWEFKIGSSWDFLNEDGFFQVTLILPISATEITSHPLLRLKQEERDLIVSPNRVVYKKDVIEVVYILVDQDFLNKYPRPFGTIGIIYPNFRDKGKLNIFCDFSYSYMRIELISFSLILSIFIFIMLSKRILKTRKRRYFTSLLYVAVIFMMIIDLWSENFNNIFPSEKWFIGTSLESISYLTSLIISLSRVFPILVFVISIIIDFEKLRWKHTTSLALPHFIAFFISSTDILILVNEKSLILFFLVKIIIAIYFIIIFIQSLWTVYLFQYKGKRGVLD